MSHHLVIVESPAKAKTINKFLGKDYTVKASMGHVRDLPQKELGVDLEDNFKPKYVRIKTRDKVLKELKSAAAGADSIILAPDPDREGEAIAWHLMHALSTKKADYEKFVRVTYNEITASAIREAFAQPRHIDENKVNSQQARRVLDRIVGYQVSPLLWRRIRGASSAGRVQSVALRLVCDREREIDAFVPEPYWIFGARLRKLVDPTDPFAVKLARIGGEKAELKSEETVRTARADLEGRGFKVKSVQNKEISKRPQPSYITSTLQQAGNRFYGFTPSRTMRIAQKLYEGVETDEGVVGLITYMRTDSVSIAKSAQDTARTFIAETFGDSYLPAQPPTYKSRSGAQEAHEAIRPTDISRTPEAMKRFLQADEWKLYKIIWERFTASQMAPARIAQRTVEIEAVPANGDADATEYLFRGSASEILFPGYMKVTGAEKPKKEEGDADEEENIPLPPLDEGENLDHVDWLEERKETTPPPRYTESSLVRALEENGVGRPSTYAQTISTILDRKYVEKEKRALKPTPVGKSTNEFLTTHLNNLFDVGFTAQMEKALDDVESGDVVWTDMLSKFYGAFQTWLESAKAPAADLEKVNGLLAMAEHVKTWKPPTKRGKKTYSDETFVQSVKEQLAEGEKPVTDRQLTALLKVLAHYREQVPEYDEKMKALGLEKEAAELKELAAPPREETQQKMELLKNVTFDEPRKVGKRTYDDKVFFESLCSQVESGKRLSENQIRYLDRMLVKYGDQVPDFEKHAETFQLHREDAAGDPAAGDVLALMGGVTEWAEPVQRGKRTWDDKAFYESLRDQFARKKSLSPRQSAALKKMAARYAGQIPGYMDKQEELGLPPPKEPKKKKTKAES